jgi:hypothetical protein
LAETASQILQANMASIMFVVLQVLYGPYRNSKAGKLFTLIFAVFFKQEAFKR